MATKPNTPATASAGTTATEKPKALKVIPKRAGFRRAGYAFPDGETTIPLADLTDAQIKQLTTEPMLVTVLVDQDEPTATASAE